MHHLTILGRPVAAKNAKMVMRGSNGRPFIGSRKGVREWMKAAVIQLRAQWQKPELLGEVAVEIKVYQGPRQAIDLDNSLAGVFDALQHADVLKNDYQIVRMQAERYRDNDNPRIEIAIKTL